MAIHYKSTVTVNILNWKTSVELFYCLIKKISFDFMFYNMDIFKPRMVFLDILFKLVFGLHNFFITLNVLDISQ